MWTPKFCGEHSCHGIAVQMRAELNHEMTIKKRDSTEIRRKILELESFRPSDVPKKSNFSWIF